MIEEPVPRFTNPFTCTGFISGRVHSTFSLVQRFKHWHIYARDGQKIILNKKLISNKRQKFYSRVIE